MNFRGKQWIRNGNHYHLVGTRINVYQWNAGANATFLVEKLGVGTFTVHGKGSEARDEAIKKALDLSKE